MIEVRPIPAPQAAHQLVGLARLDPRGMLSDADIPAMCDRGECFELVAADGRLRAVYVLEVRNGVAWVSALAGSGQGLDVCQVFDGVTTRQAAGLQRLAFQTARPGLVRKMSGFGYRVTGWIMVKEIH